MTIDTTSWVEFKIGDLFELRKGTRLTKANMAGVTAARLTFPMWRMAALNCHSCRTWVVGATSFFAARISR